MNLYVESFVIEQARIIHYPSSTSQAAPLKAQLREGAFPAFLSETASSLQVVILF